MAGAGSDVGSGGPADDNPFGQKVDLIIGDQVRARLLSGADRKHSHGQLVRIDRVIYLLLSDVGI